VLLLAFGLAACGSGDDGDGGYAGIPEVNVTLAEWVISADPLVVDAGDMTFKTSNEDGLPHELVVLKTTLGASRLLVESAVADEAAASLVIGEIEPAELPPGGASATFDLEAGTYVLPSLSPAHDGLGIRTAFVVQ
jgi:hypothetical protein